MKACSICSKPLPTGSVFHRRLMITTCERCALIVRAARVTTGRGFASRSDTLRQLRAAARPDQPVDLPKE